MPRNDYLLNWRTMYNHWQEVRTTVQLVESEITNSTRFKLQKTKNSQRDVVSLTSAIFSGASQAVCALLFKFRDGHEIVLTIQMERTQSLLGILNAHTDEHGANYEDQAAATARIGEFTSARDALRNPAVSDLAQSAVKNLYLASSRRGITVTFETIMHETGTFDLDDIAVQGFAAELEGFWQTLPSLSANGGSQRH